MVKKKKEEKKVVSAFKGAKISIVEFAISDSKFRISLAITKAIKTLDPTYNEDRYRDEWEVIYRAFITKPVNQDWKEHLFKYMKA